MSSFKVEKVEESVCSIAGMHLFNCEDTNSIYWVDAFGGQAQKMDLNDSKKVSVFKILGETIFGFCIPIQGQSDQFIVGAGKRLLQVKWDGIHSMAKIEKVLAEIDFDGVRMNQARVDKNGRLFFGTVMDEVQVKRPIDIFDRPRIGGLFRYTAGEGLVELKSKIGFPNGISWNSSWTKMFFVDSFDLAVYEFDYDDKTGSISNQKVFVDITKFCVPKINFPMGMTIDVDDNLYLAVFGSGKVLKINTKTKNVEQEIDVHLKQITGCEFGGKNSDVMFISTVSMSAGPDYETKNPHGKLIKISGLGTKGAQLYKYNSK